MQPRGTEEGGAAPTKWIGVGRWSPAMLAVGLFALVLAVYRATMGFGFVNVDDQSYVTSNAVVQGGLTWSGVHWAFSTVHASNWHPLTWLSHMADVSLFGLDAGAHHAVSVVLHALNSALLLLWLRKATGSTWRSALAAALFAVHPLHVESVAWVSERKDVLSTLFWLLAMFGWLGWTRKPSAGRYVLVVVPFVLGLLAKPMVVSLPFALLLVDAWPLARAGRLAGPVGSAWRRILPLVVEKAPLCALSIASAIITLVAQSGKATSPFSDLPLGDRIGNAVFSYAAYLGQTVWPSGLSAFYPHPSIWGGEKAASLVAGAAILLVVISVAVILVRKKCPWMPWGWAWYLGTLVPVIGIIQVGVQARADRYTYIPSIGIFVALSWTVGWVAGESRKRRMAAGALAVAWIATLSLVARNQVETWRSSESLWRHAIAVTDLNWAAWAGLADALHEPGRMEESVAAGQQSLRLNPRNARAWNVVGIGLAQLGQMDEAARHLRQAIQLDPRYGEAWYNLGTSYGVQGDHARAAEALARAAALEPDNPNVWANLAVARFKGGDAAGAEAAMRQVERLDPARAAAMRGP